MPWKETHVVDSRLEFVLRTLREEVPFRDLCTQYGISPKTGYKWTRRFLEHGPQSLHDLSRKPHHCPSQLAEDAMCEMIRIKIDHKGWGPRKVRQVYARKYPEVELPSDSTFKRVLEKAGLVHKRKRKPSDTCGRIELGIVPDAPNVLWTVDFKGWWYTANRQRCEPLTVRDGYSRFVLCAAALDDAKSITVRRQFERLFETHGLPLAIRSDNGTPFACTRAPLGLSRLSAWWVALGITWDPIPPGRPDKNGGHERMHRDIALEVESVPETDLRHQRAALEAWRHTFNFQRPHEALGMRTPAEVYCKSQRPFPNQPHELSYPAGFLTRKVNQAGAIRLHAVRLTISTAVSGWHLGLKPSGADGFLVYFGPLCLGVIDLRTEAFKAAYTQPD
jgi:transposase InsO family protein